MNLKPIPNYENLYSFDLNNNKVYTHYQNKYLKITLSNNGYYKIVLIKNKKQKHIMFHRLIYEMYNGTIPEKMFIDHIDCNKLNNNIDNLRLVNKSQNGCNVKKLIRNKTGHKNIKLTKYNNYCIQIMKNYKIEYCKTFKTLEEAIINRDIQLKLIHKEFHNLG